MLASHSGQRISVSTADGAQQFAGLFLLLFQIQDCLLRVPGPHDRRKRVIEKTNAGTMQVGAALSADRTRPARVSNQVTRRGLDSCNKQSSRAVNDASQYPWACRLRYALSRIQRWRIIQINPKCLFC